MLTTLAVVAMVLAAAYLWRSSEFLHCISARPHGEEDITSTGALLLMRLLCIAVLIFAVMFVWSSRQPAANMNPESFELESQSASAESTSGLSASTAPAAPPQSEF